MRTKLLSVIAIALSSTAWGAGHGHMSSAGGHGFDVSQAAHNARAGGQPVGPSVRDVARSKSQGPSHASATALAHANSHSVLAANTSTTAAKPTGRGKSKVHGHSRH